MIDANCERQVLAQAVTKRESRSSAGKSRSKTAFSCESFRPFLRDVTNEATVRAVVKARAVFCNTLGHERT
jgi:hypothetical protein